MYKKLLFVIIFLISVLYSKWTVSQTPLTTAPNFTAIDSRGNYHDLYSYLNNGQYVLLDFFYNECLVCQTHVPEVDDAYIQFGCNAHEVFFLGVNFENTDGEVITFENEYGLHYSNISGDDGGGNDIVSLFQVIAFPTIILIAPDKSIPKPDIWPLTMVNIIDELLSVGVDTMPCPYAGIQDRNFDNKFSIYPNPAKDYVYITPHPTSDNHTIHFSDCLGREMLNIEGTESEKINLSGLQPGIYFINIMQGSIKLHTEKLLIY